MKYCTIYYATLPLESYCGLNFWIFTIYTHIWLISISLLGSILSFPPSILRRKHQKPLSSFLMSSPFSFIVSRVSLSRCLDAHITMQLVIFAFEWQQSLF